MTKFDKKVESMEKERTEREQREKNERIAMRLKAYTDDEVLERIARYGFQISLTHNPVAETL